jgi:hypothetical protein
VHSWRPRAVVPAFHTADKIAHWLVTECEAIPGWSWSLFRDAHVRSLDNLRAFVKRRGWDALATRPIIDGARLDKWVHHRREEYRLGELDDWIIRGLEAIPGWTWDPRRAGYESNLRVLREYVARHGWSALDAHTITDTGVHIGNWTVSMRAMHRRNELEQWVVDELEKIPGWAWEPRITNQLANVGRLAAFVATHGWEAVIDKLVLDGVKMGDWIGNCRTRYRTGGLSKETIDGLEAIPGWDWSGRSSWSQPKDDAGRLVPVSVRKRRRRARSGSASRRP